MPRTGDECIKRGLYVTSCCLQRVRLGAGERFPTCTHCLGRQALWFLFESKTAADSPPNLPSKETPVVAPGPLPSAPVRHLGKDD